MQDPIGPTSKFQACRISPISSGLAGKLSTCTKLKFQTSNLKRCQSGCKSLRPKLRWTNMPSPMDEWIHHLYPEHVLFLEIKQSDVHQMESRWRNFLLLFCLVLLTSWKATKTWEAYYLPTWPCSKSSVCILIHRYSIIFIHIWYRHVFANVCCQSLPAVGQVKIHHPQVHRGIHKSRARRSHTLESPNAFSLIYVALSFTALWFPLQIGQSFQFWFAKCFEIFVLKVQFSLHHAFRLQESRDTNIACINCDNAHRFYHFLQTIDMLAEELFGFLTAERFLWNDSHQQAT